LEIEGQQKAPDYAFRVGTLPKFFTEAKKCGINISADPAPAYQLRRYGWSAKVSLSILTDFEEFGVYDCSQRPRPNEKASHARIQYLQFTEYPDRWREIWDVFSREAVWSGSFDQYADHKKKRGTSEVDTEFLKDIERWRDELARNLALRNGDLSADDLNAAVQRIIDRIIFLRMAEDRGLEPESQLLKLCDKPDVYSRFMSSLCQKADAKYNSGLFHFTKESGVSEVPDSLTPKLEVDDKILKPILQSLYFEHGSPYHFGVLPVEILGTVYERFLGKVIRLTTAHHAKVEEKPEVRKAGGVYYTPAYIVDYIVKNTVGKQVEGKSPAEFARGKNKQPLRVLDMACGSGSFLLGAYQFLLDHCLKWYVANEPAKHSKAVYQGAKGEWRLTIAERKRILTTHLFGVDIDRQAVEVTKLSLLLKALEGENDASLSQQMQLFHERGLPNLADNIKCGNSLIGPGYFTRTLLPDAREMGRVNPFDWQKEFPDAMKAGGFDCIIGNPPYIRIQTMKEWAPLEVEILKDSFRSASIGNYDIYVVFLEQGLGLLNPKGHLGFICPHKFFNSQYGESIRAFISSGKHLTHVVHFGDQQVFEGATTYTCIVFLSKPPVSGCRFVKVSNLTKWQTDASGVERFVEDKQITQTQWNFEVGPAAGLFDKLSSMPTKLRDVADRIFQGLVTGADPVFILQHRSKGRYYSEATEEEHKIERELMHPLCKGSVNLKRYYVTDLTKSILFPYKLVDGKAVLLTAKELSSEYPHAWEYLKRNRTLLESRERGKWKHDRWYAFGRSQNLAEMEQKKLLTPSIASRASFSLDTNDLYYFVGSGGGGGGGYGITLRSEEQISYDYVLGLLNSKLLDKYLKSYSSPFSGGYFAFNRQYIELLCIQRIDFSNSTDKARHDQMVRLVVSMLSLHRDLDKASPSQRETILRQIDATDENIDHLVYELYGLSDEEIRIVEGDG
jgi:SAM-dependent methyltransferase